MRTDRFVSSPHIFAPRKKKSRQAQVPTEREKIVSLEKQIPLLTCILVHNLCVQFTYLAHERHIQSSLKVCAQGFCPAAKAHANEKVATAKKLSPNLDAQQMYNNR